MADQIIVDAGGTIWREDAEARIFRGENAKPVPGDVPARNKNYRAWLKPGDTWAAKVTINGVTYTVSSGVASPTVGYSYCLEIATRTTPDSNKPALPTLEAVVVER